VRLGTEKTNWVTIWVDTKKKTGGTCTGTQEIQGLLKKEGSLICRGGSNGSRKKKTASNNRRGGHTNTSLPTKIWRKSGGGGQEKGAWTVANKKRNSGGRGK